MKHEKEQKEINIEQVVRYLNTAFTKATEGMGRAIRQRVTKDYKRNNKGETITIELSRPRIEKTPLYDIQVEFTYLIDEIQRGPKYLIPKVISDANKLIDTIVSNKS